MLGFGFKHVLILSFTSGDGFESGWGQNCVFLHRQQWGRVFRSLQSALNFELPF